MYVTELMSMSVSVCMSASACDRISKYTREFVSVCVTELIRMSVSVCD